MKNCHHYVSTALSHLLIVLRGFIDFHRPTNKKQSSVFFHERMRHGMFNTNILDRGEWRCGVSQGEEAWRLYSQNILSHAKIQRLPFQPSD
jgi:hypothetical protein